ncbi:unnamed protein product [Porites evermanni]|uniref:GH18 domain-containing protein n=1 Tax=Porites evermanni TaxID=104178 RepID=A0ABN8SED5_9CNID|nr:unnamed protein product [Porites evermanni]
MAFVIENLANVVLSATLTRIAHCMVSVGETRTSAAHHQAIVMQHLATVVPGVVQSMIVRVAIAGKKWRTAAAPTRKITLWEHTSGCCREENGLLYCMFFVPSEVNYMLLGFADDPSQTGNFEVFSMWVSMGITYDSIASDKAANPGRKYMISIGGSADSGGMFGIAGGMSVSQWVDNADNSISSIVNSYNADGVDIQFEGGTSDPDFSTAITLLAQRFKARGFLVSVGPFRGYDGTWNDYISLPLNDVDYVFCQFYAKNLQSVDSVVSDITSAANDLGSWSKLIAGFNSNNRNPNPSTALQAVYQLKSSLKGTFTWSAEDSQSNSPPYCIEKNSANILNNNQQPGSCNW